MKCGQPGCSGEILDGYCNVCGMAAPRAAVATSAPSGSATVSAPPPGPSGTSSRARTGGRRRLGGGIVDIAPIADRDPASAIMADATVAESRRFCSRCDAPVGRERDGTAGRSEGFCRSCGAPFSFRPKLVAGDLVGGQYEVVGCLAHGGMGWVYLARDRNVSDRWVVLKGVLDAGDRDATAAAIAERRFLAEVEHPNIVKIFNFVQHESSGYIVMEYVGGESLKQILAARRAASGDRPDPLPVAQAVAYMIEILPALGYLHDRGLMFCDFKLDNVIQTGTTVKLIDLGGVYRIDEPSDAIYGTAGYQAPEIATAGPSPASDLYTVGRTLAILCFDFRGYQGIHRFTLPPQQDVPVLSQFDSLYRLLVKATAPDREERFQSADEMIVQLEGILREVVAAEQGKVLPHVSSLFTPDRRATPQAADWRRLPLPQVDGDDPASGFLASLPATGDDGRLIAELRNAPQRTVEVELRLARALIEHDEIDEAVAVLDDLERGDPWDWRPAWYRGVAAFAQSRYDAARAHLERVYHAVPGELAPKLAVGVAAELGGDPAAAACWYEVVSRTDPSYATAAFGLARCRSELGDRAGALAAFSRVPDSSSAYLDAQVARIKCLTDDGRGPSELPSLRDADATIDALALDAAARARLRIGLLRAALRLDPAAAAGDAPVTLAGCAVEERELRFGLERALRELAHLVPDPAERIELVDEANRSRPRTWT
jgi:serine/threonine-protein kinase PknG